MITSILAFGASNSKHSINKQLASYAANSIPNAQIDLLDLNDYEMPLFSVDREKDSGIPPAALDFKERIKRADGIIISFAEHNGAYTAAFKNIYDWVSRIEKNVWLDKPMFLLSTSPGARGGKNVLHLAIERYSHANKNTIVHFSLPSFDKHFSKTGGILDTDLNNAFSEQLAAFIDAL